LVSRRAYLLSTRSCNFRCCVCYMAATGKPLQLVKLIYDETDRRKGTVEVNEAHLETLKEKLKATGADKIAILSVMGAFRTGKSFILNFMLRFLRYEQKCRAEGKDPNEGWSHPDRTCDDSGKKLLENYPIPAWMKDAGNSIEGVGNEGGNSEGGFKFKAGEDRCTEGIWVWPEPFVRTIDGEEVALLLMDTQGAWDGQMAAAQSATIFGLTAVLSSKQVYNINKQIQEDHVKNLVYFMENARAAIRKAAGPGAKSEEVDRCFQALGFLVRDCPLLYNKMNMDECSQKMKDVLAKQTNPENLAEEAAKNATTLQSMFQDIGCFCMPRPGDAVEQDDYEGKIEELSNDFVRFLDHYMRDIFQTNLPAKTILGNPVTPLTFDKVVKEYAACFKNAAPDYELFANAQQKVSQMCAQEKVIEAFQANMNTIMKAHPQGMPEDKFKEEMDRQKRVASTIFENCNILGGEKIRASTWKDTEEAIGKITGGLIETNARKLAKALVAFANITMLAIALFIGDKASDYTCDWWSNTCVHMSRLAQMGYLGIGLYVGVFIYFIFQQRGQTATMCALLELQQEMVKLFGDYCNIVKTTNWNELIDKAKQMASKTKQS